MGESRGSPPPADAPVAPPLPGKETPAGCLGVVLVNWNRHAFTVECLESLLRSPAPLRVAVVDNASSDDSLNHLARWASGDAPYAPPEGPMGAFSTPPLPKPIAVTQLSADEARRTPPVAGQLSFIDGGANLGFAGGNNLGIRHLLLDPDIHAVWLLNNDTVVDPDAAGQILRMFQARPQLGMCGTIVKHYFDPEIVQALNGSRFHLLTGASKSIGGGKPLSSRVSPKEVVEQTDFVLGASLAVSRTFLEKVGLMSEDYFLYYEEIDWATRNRNYQQPPFETGFARGAVVYHKEGGSIGSGGRRGKRSAMSDYYLLRARFIFYRKYYPVLLPLQWLLAGGQVCRRLLRREPAKAVALLKAMFGRPF